MEIVLQPGEVKIDTWTLFYLPPGGGKYNGKLTVTNRRLLYDAKFDASLMGVLASTLVIQSGSEGYLEIDKQYIQSVDTQKESVQQEVHSHSHGWKQAHLRLRRHEHR